MKILFIGGTGLISTAIVTQLLDQGHQITLFNRGSSQSRLPAAGYEVVHGDRSDFAVFEQTFKGKTYDVVVDMVAFNPDQSASAVRAFAGSVGQFIHCSTVCVYSGPVKTIPTPETEPFHSIGGYGKNKILCEQLLMEAHAGGSLPVTIMRPSHSYGEGGWVIRPFGSPDTFLDRLRKGKPVVVPGDGTGLWASCHVDDVAKGFIAVMGVSRCCGEAYNIASDEYMTWNAYHEAVAEAAGGTYNPVYIPTSILAKAAPAMAGGLTEIFAWPSIFDNSKVKKDTEYAGQTIAWSEGVKRNIDWLDAQGWGKDSSTATEEDRLIERFQEGTANI
jgi:nucleoside-diphosphate-sugar epimerase